MNSCSREMLSPMIVDLFIKVKINHTSGFYGWWMAKFIQKSRGDISKKFDDRMM